MTKSILGKGSIYLTYTADHSPSLREAKARTQVGTWGRNHRILLAVLLAHSCLLRFLIHPRTTCVEKASALNSLALLRQLITKTPSCQSDLGNFCLRFPSQMTRGYFKFDNKN